MRLEAALVEAIPAMAMHSAALPFVNRALVQLPLTGAEPSHQIIVLGISCLEIAQQCLQTKHFMLLRGRFLGDWVWRGCAAVTG